MSHDGRFGRVFFASIPKSGKNILYSFFGELGLSREPALEEDRELAAQHTYLQYFSDLDSRATFANPAGTGASDLATHAMERFLSRLSSLHDGTVLGHHFAFSRELYDRLRTEQIPMVFLYRDPRDCLLSMANYVLHKGMPPHWVPKMSHLQLDEVLTLLLTGDHETVPFAPYFECFRGWLEADGVFKLRFEDIIGPRGGGREDAQIEHLIALAEHVGWRGSPHCLARAILRSFNPSAGTFYKGQIGSWREGFSPRILHLFEEVAGHLLAPWGYEDALVFKTADAGPPKHTTTSLLAAMRHEDDEMVADFERKLQDREMGAETRLELLRKQEAAAAEWRERYLQAEEESRARLEVARRWEAEAEKWKARVEKVEAESHARLELLRQREAAAAEWRERYLRAEEESRARLEVARRWEAEAEKWKARAATAEDESLKQLDRLRRQDAEAQKLRQEIDQWKNEGLWARLLRTLRSGGSRSAQ